MIIYVVTPKALPKAGAFFTRSFGVTPAQVLFFPGPMGNEWEGATFQGALFHVYNPAATVLDWTTETFLRSLFPGAQLHCVQASWADEQLQSDLVEPFVLNELLPALADETDGIVTDGTKALYRAGADRRHDAPHLRRLLAEREALAPARPGEDDWSDL